MYIVDNWSGDEWSSWEDRARAYTAERRANITESRKTSCDYVGTNAEIQRGRAMREWLDMTNGRGVAEL